MQARAKTRIFDIPSPEEDAAITAGALNDPDSRPQTDAEITAMKRQRGKRGPQKTATKCQVTLRLDPEVIDFFKASGRGWQSRINETLLEDIHAKMKTAA